MRLIYFNVVVSLNIFSYCIKLSIDSDSWLNKLQLRFDRERKLNKRIEVRNTLPRVFVLRKLVKD